MQMETFALTDVRGPRADHVDWLSGGVLAVGPRPGWQPVAIYMGWFHQLHVRSTPLNMFGILSRLKLLL
jgi:hypothetical protein